MDTRFFFFVLWQKRSAPVKVECEGGAAAWLVGTLWRQVCRNCPPPTGVTALSESVFKPLVAGDQKASLANLSL